MSAPRQAQCLLRQPRFASSLPLPASRRGIHQTASRAASNNNNNNNVPDRRQQGRQQRQSGGKISTQKPWERREQSRQLDNAVPVTRESADKYLPPYSAEEMEFLRRKYTPEQMAAIEAGEAAIDPVDILKQGVIRNDYGKVNYVDDFRNIHPVLDQQPRASQANYDPDLRLKTDDEIDEDLAGFWEKAVAKGEDGNTELDFEKFMDGYRYTVGAEEAERDPPDYNAPRLNRLTDPMVKRTVPDEAEAAQKNADQDYWNRLCLSTGLSEDYIRSLRRKTLVNNFVSNQTRMGKIRSMLVVTVVGNERGLLGVGLGKATEPQRAEQQAFAAAVRSMAPIPRYENRTIYGDAKGKVGATVVELYNRPPGFGVRCQSKIFEMARCAGITDLAAKVPRGRNPMNTVKAAYEALMNQRLPDAIARGRGRKMVDVRKVYYAGMV